MREVRNNINTIPAHTKYGTDFIIFPVERKQNPGCSTSQFAGSSLGLLYPSTPTHFAQVRHRPQDLSWGRLKPGVLSNRIFCHTNRHLGQLGKHLDSTHYRQFLKRSPSRSEFCCNVRSKLNCNTFCASSEDIPSLEIHHILLINIACLYKPYWSYS